MSDAPSVRRATAADMPAVDDLLAAWHGPERAARRRAWFAKAPQGDPRVWIVRQPDGEIAATTAMFPRAFVVRGKRYTGALGGDAFVAPSARRQGIARKLHAATHADMEDRGLDFMYGPPRPENLSALLKAGAKAVGEVRFFHRPLDREGLAERMGADPSALRRGATRVGGLALRALSGRGAARLDEAQEIDASFDALWADAATWHRVAAVRDAAWLDWRFLQAHTPARIWTLGEGPGLRGWAAVLVRDGRLLILDLLARTRADVEPLLRGVLGTARAEGCHTVETRLNPRTAYARAARRQGFVVGRTRNVFQVLAKDPPPALLDSRGWHLTYGDEDVEDWPAWFQPPAPLARRSSKRPPRKVVLLMDIFVDTHGGTEGQVATLIRGLPRHWQPELWVVQQSEFVRMGGLPCPTRELELPAMKDPRFLPRLRTVASALKSERVDLIHGYHIDTCTLAPMLGAMAGIPVITSRRDFGYWQTPRVLEGLRRANRLVRRIVCNAEAVVQRTVEVENAHPDQVAHVPNGHPRERFDIEKEPGFRARYGLPTDARLVGLVANYRALKRQEDLVRALAALGGRFDDVHVAFVGAGKGWDKLDALALELGVADRVHRPACTTQVLPFLAELSVGALCSESEGLSNAIIEYMAMGLPVVASAVGGNPELVRDGETGFVYPAGNVQELAEALTHLLGDPDRARAMGRAGRARFEAEFSLEEMVRRTTQVWERALAEHAGERPQALHVSTLRTVEDLEALAPTWEALCGPFDVFVAPDWILTWFQTTRAKPHVLVAREGDGRLVGVWPLAREGKRLVLAGQDMGSDHLDVVAEPGLGASVITAFWSALEDQRWSRIDIRHARERGILRTFLRREVGKITYRERLATVCPYVDASGGDFGAYLASHFRSKSRTRVRKGVRQFHALPAAKVLRVGDAGFDVRTAVDRLFRLHESRAEEATRASSFANSRSRAFHDALAARLHARGALHLVMLETADGDLAVDYGFRFGGRLVAFQSGMREHAEIYSPGTVLNAIVLEQDVFGRGLREYDFLDGDEAYKLRFSDGVRRLYDIRLFPRGRWPRVRAMIGGITRIVKSEVKRLLRK